MSEELFELYLDDVDTDIDARAFASKLSPLLSVDEHQIEKKIVKVKLLHGRSEALKSGLVEEKAHRLQKLLNSWGLVTSVKAEWSLLPIEEIETKETFTCPACGFEQEFEVEQVKICSECGVVKEKYETLQKRKALAAIQAKQQKLIAEGAKDKAYTSIEQRNRDFLEKRRRKAIAKHKKKVNVTALSMFGLVLAALGAGIYMYKENHSAETQDNAVVVENPSDPATQNASLSASSAGDANGAAATEVGNGGGESTNAEVATVAETRMDDAGNNAVMEVDAQTSPEATATATADANNAASGQQKAASTTVATTTASTTDNELGVPGNPYSQLTGGSSLPPISMQDAPKYINKLLKKNKAKLPAVDADALGDISTLYDEADQTQQEAPDFKEIKKIANSVSDQDIRGTLIKQAAWQEMDLGVKTFDDFGIRSIQRAGAENGEIALLYEDIKLAIKDYQYNKAANLASQIREPYLHAVALNKIMDSQFYLDLEGAKKQRDKMRDIVDHYGLTQSQKTLVLGLIYQADRRLGEHKYADATFQQLQLAISDVKQTKERVVTLIQLAEDQREGLNFTDAQNFLDTSYQQIRELKLSDKDSDQLHGMLAQSYAKLFEFGRANTLLAYIKNGQEKSRVANMVTLIEKKAAL